ncbi:MAG TPA: hypothetical protein VK507_17095 [Iamia sp.]|nr:hypothetical protein [Iamia sp.]
MLTFRRHHHEHPAWVQAPACAEYRASGLELRLIDLVELRGRSARAGFDDVTVLDAEIAEVRAELAALGIDPQGLEHLAA